jgi:hypothetical protein
MVGWIPLSKLFSAAEPYPVVTLYIVDEVAQRTDATTQPHDMRVQPKIQDAAASFAPLKFVEMAS